MRIDVYHHFSEPAPPSVVRLLHTVLTKLDLIMAKDAEVLATLNTLQTTLTSIGAGVDKVGTETQALLGAVADLRTALENAGGTSPEVDAALAAVQASVDSLASKVQAVDALVPDAPTP